MGGGGHGEIPKVPDWRSYRIEDAPKLVLVQQRLAQRGLKDPWLRNEVWRYNSQWRTVRQNVMFSLTRGMKVGIVAFLATIALEKYFGIDYHFGHHDNHHEGHHDEEHH